MFLKRLFGKKPTIKTIGLDIRGWDSVEDSALQRIWRKETLPAQLSINFFKAKPDIPSLSDLHKLRTYYRDLSNKGGMGVLKIELLEIKGLQTIETLFKYPLQQGGFAYIGSLTIPFQDYSYVIKIQSAEMQRTGIREAVITDQLLGEGQKNLFGNWIFDPYDASLKEGLLMNQSELEKYDPLFLDHPLTIVRAKLGWIKSELQLGELLYKLDKFK